MEIEADCSCCFATATDERYLPGTLLLLSTFRKYNPWYSGSTVIIHDRLPEKCRRQLDRLFDVKYHQVSDSLKNRLSAMGRRNPQLARRLPRFHSLEAFNLPACDTVVFVDSDVLCTGNVREIFNAEGGLLACPDLTFYREQVRNFHSFLPLPGPPSGRSDEIPVSFNTGLLVIRGRELERDVFDLLLDGLDPDEWSGVRSGHTDQVVLNRHFRKGWSPLPGKYNFLIPNDEGKHTGIRISMEEAAFVHFLGWPKPWEGRLGHDWAKVSGDRRAANRMWDGAWKAFAVECLATRRYLRPMRQLAVRRLWRLAARIRHKISGWVRRRLGGAIDPS